MKKKGVIDRFEGDWGRIVELEDGQFIEYTIWDITP